MLNIAIIIDDIYIYRDKTKALHVDELIIEFELNTFTKMECFVYFLWNYLNMNHATYLV